MKTKGDILISIFQNTLIQHKRIWKNKLKNLDKKHEKLL